MRQLLGHERLPVYVGDIDGKAPIGRSRNEPQRLAAPGLWLGWAVFDGSMPVLGGAALWGAAKNFVIIPREEQALEAVFGDADRHYKDSAPRWL